MRRRPSSPPFRRLLGVAAIVAALGSLPLTAQPMGGRAPPGNAAGHAWPLWAAFAAVAVCGVAGAFAADLVVDGGRIDRPARGATERLPGSAGKALVGAAAALATLMLDPPTTGATLVGAALYAGAGAEAILLAIRSRRQADAAECERDRSREHAEAVARTAAEQIESTRQSVLTAYRGLAAGMTGDGAHSPGGDLFERSVNSAFAQARRALAALSAAQPLWDQVRGILVRRFGPREVDARPLGELVDARTLRLVAGDIAQRFPQLDPPWTAEDVRPDSTLASLVNDIDGRTG
jgi:hypothetical protein